MRYNADSGAYLGYEYEVTHMSLEQLLHENERRSSKLLPVMASFACGCLAQLPVRGDAESDLDFLVETGGVTSAWFLLA